MADPKPLWREVLEQEERCCQADKIDGCSGEIHARIAQAIRGAQAAGLRLAYQIARKNAVLGVFGISEVLDVADRIERGEVYE